MPKILIKKDELTYDGRYLKVVRRHFCGTSGRAGMWEMVKRKMHGRIVAVVALTARREIILTDIYRIPLERRVIEICAGLPDKKGESEEALARRELLEETGYSVGKLQKLMAGPFNAGLLADEMVVFLGTGAKRVRKPELEDSEDIKVLKIPLKKLHAFLAHPPRGVKVDIKLFGVLYLLERLYKIRKTR